MKLACLFLFHLSVETEDKGYEKKRRKRQRAEKSYEKDPNYVPDDDEEKNDQVSNASSGKYYILVWTLWKASFLFESVWIMPN